MMSVLPLQWLTLFSDYHVGRVRAFFRMPSHLAAELPDVYAYIEWFTDPTITSGTTCGMFSVARQLLYGQHRVTSVIPVSDIFRSCHLLPIQRSGNECPAEWTSQNVLERAPRLFVNSYLDPHMYSLTH
jgi:hypothetical protein